MVAKIVHEVVLVQSQRFVPEHVRFPEGAELMRTMLSSGG